MRKRPTVIFLPCYRDERMLQGLCRYASEANWILDLNFYHMGTLSSRQDIDGIICMLPPSAHSSSIGEFVGERRNIPTVDLSLNDPSFCIPRVLQDSRPVGRSGAQHLIACGCRHLVFGSGMSFYHTERRRGFLEVAAENGLNAITVTPKLGHVHRTGDTEWLTAPLRGLNRPIGFMAASDQIGQLAILVALEAGISVPEDIAVLGVDNMPEICELSPVPMSSIDNNAYRHAYEGGRLLDRLMSGGAHQEEPILVPPGVMHVRESTDIMATRHPLVAQALRHVAENFKDRNLTANAVGTRIPMSVRRLHDAFVKHVGRTISQEILHRRLQFALSRVESSSDKLWEVAEASGFSSAEVMSRAFSRELGHPPSYYRHPG